jgi:pimeloyl-ACP methyl ester carboxylesterase
MTPQTVEAGGVALAVDVRGDGPPVVFVHGIAAARDAWREVVDALGDDVRSIVYDRRAYGDSGAPEPYTGTTVGEQADDLAELLEALGVAGAVVVGHGLGAMIGLETLLRFQRLVKAAVLIDPPVLWLSPLGPDAVGDLRDAIELGARDGGPAGAVEAYLEHVAGLDALELYGPERADRARSDVQAFAADLVAGPSWTVRRRDLRGVTAPVAVVTGRRSSPVWNQVSVALAELMPTAELIELDSGHLAMLEQPEAVADAVRRRL